MLIFVYYWFTGESLFKLFVLIVCTRMRGKKPQPQIEQEFALGLCNVLPLKGEMEIWFWQCLMCTSKHCQMPWGETENLKNRIS